MSLASWIVLTAVSLIFSALFSGTEIAFITSDRVRVELDVQKGGLISRILNKFYTNRDFFISSILVGNNIMLVVYGMGASALLNPWLNTLSSNEAVILILSTLISTFVILLTGEFFPKTIFRINPNTSFKVFAIPIYLFYLIFYPISAFTTWISKFFMNIFGIKSENSTTGMLSMMELNNYLDRTIDDVSPRSDRIENEVKIFHNALDFSSTHLRDCMVPRNEIVAVSIDDTDREQLSALFTETGRSKIVVYKDDIDDVKGYIHVSELFDLRVDWKTRIKPVVFVPEALLANKMMRRLLGEKRSMAIVVDEFGGTAGMVTLEDLVEEIFGDIQDEHDSTKSLVREISPGVFDCSGRVEVEYLRENFHIDIPDEDDYQTLAGYILFNLGQLPPQGEKIDLADKTFTILKRTSTRLELIRIETHANQ
ncbi:MAG: HlyC/CorC family transporter [Paramuribaculum sp.]|nr:HlyC/CorC family transporter [Paramuribaculum sp.]